MRPFISCILLLTLFQSVIYAMTPSVRNSSKGIELCNERAIIVLSNQAELLSCTDAKSGDNIVSSARKKIASASLISGVTIEADRIILQGNQLTIIFGNRQVETQVRAFADYFTVDVLRAPSDIEALTFIDLRLKYDYSSTNPFLAVGLAMTLQTNQVFYPSGESKEVKGSCYSKTGIYGAKIAIIACRKNELRGIIKTVYKSIPKGQMPINTVGGGPFALDGEANRYDCVMIREVSPSKVPEWISFYSKLGIKQLDFIKGNTTFVQGDFSFPGTGSAAAFKTQITDPLYKAGFISSLHTYSYYISYTSTEILRNPKWQQQLEFRESFSLSKSIDSKATDINVSGNKAVLKNDDLFYSVHTPYILIDNEIIKFTIGKDGFVSCKRGQCGTTALAHKAGAVVRIIGGYYSHIAPQIGSDLFFEIARRTAKAYNEGGFRGFYFDAFDGLGIHLRYAGLNDFLWYYGAAFINEVLKYCEREPLVVEYSDMIHSVWSARGRGGAWDTPSRGYKGFIDEHLERNRTLMSRQYVTTLGWYNFYPTKKGEPADFSTKYMFFDDVDYLGAKAVAYDQTMVYNSLLETSVKSIPALKRNLELYAQYNKLRQSGYFSENIKCILKEGKFEYKLAKRNGAWGFKEVVYDRTKLRNIALDRFIGHNPFKEQKPLIRLENMYSSNCSSTVPLLSFNEASDAFVQKCEATFAKPLDLSKHLAICVTVKGKGNSSKEAICVRLRSYGANGYADYVVNLNFNGWRDIILPNLDNAEDADLKFRGMDVNLYNMYRRDVDYSRVKDIKIYKTGDCKDVRIRKIDAVPLLPNAISNPTVHISTASVTFLDCINSGEYIEYYVGEKTALVYDRVGNTRVVKVASRGRFRIPKGDYYATVSGIPELKDVPSEVVLTFGLYGSFIKN